MAADSNLPPNNDKDTKKTPDGAHTIDVGDDITPELEALLHTDFHSGLIDAEVAERTEKFGLNGMCFLWSHQFITLVRIYLICSISYLIEVACIISGALQHWPDFGILLALLLINAFIGYAEEAKAENALESLKNNLATYARVRRNGQFVEIQTKHLVPGDIVNLRLGDIIPADVRLLGIGASGEENDDELQIDQAALTGESLPVHVGKGKVIFSSSIVKQGQMLAVVVKTGINTFIGRAANLISITNEEGHFQKIIGLIGKYLIVMTIVFVIIVLAVRLAQGIPFVLVLDEVVVLTIAAIPVGLPTVLSVTMAVGAKQLAAKQVIVKRLPAIEEFASVSILCSDKTGTLTLNELTFDDPFLANGFTERDVLLYAFLASEPGAHEAIELAVRAAAKERVDILKELNKENEHKIPGFKIVKFTPFNPNDKYTKARVRNLETEEEFECIKGAPHVVIRLCGGDKKAEETVIDFAQRGLRALGVAKTCPDGTFSLVGLISLLDPPRPDSGFTIKECNKLGVDVKMITGDQVIIGKEVARRLGMQRCILNAAKLIDPNADEEELTRRCERSDGFGQVIPEHKYRVVELLQRKGHLVGMTGDGVNDAPALKKANVGIAVQGCTDAARSAADIVLLAPGLSTIVDGIRTSRAIFQRMRSYAIYRITSTIHFLIFFFFAIIFYNFSLPNGLIILIAVLNDAATMVIAIDNARISGRPDKWRLGQLITLSTTLGLLLTIASFGHYWVAVKNLEAHQVSTVMYLQISSCPHFVIFSTRVSSFFWTSPPSLLFTFAIAGTQVFAMFMSIYGWEVFSAAPIGWAWGVSVMAISIAVMAILDAVKVCIFSNWSFALTARLWPVKSRRDKLAQRLVKQKVDARVRKNWKLVRDTMVMFKVIVAFKGTEHKFELGKTME